MHVPVEVKADFIELSKRYHGKWVALDPETQAVVAVGTSAIEVYEASKSAGVEQPLITKISDDYGAYVPWLLPGRA